jgi:hypothetical protein
VAAVLAWPRRVPATALRRWQLAARASGAVAMLVRLDAGSIDAVRREPTWADARVAVAPGARLPRQPEGFAPGESAGALFPWPASPRWLKLVLVGGPWQGDVPLEEPAVELALDVVRGVEIVRPSHQRHQRRDRNGGDAAGGVACRAS